MSPQHLWLLYSGTGYRIARDSQSQGFYRTLAGVLVLHEPPKRLRRSTLPLLGRLCTSSLIARSALTNRFAPSQPGRPPGPVSAGLSGLTRDLCSGGRNTDLQNAANLAEGETRQFCGSTSNSCELLMFCNLTVVQDFLV